MEFCGLIGNVSHRLEFWMLAAQWVVQFHRTFRRQRLLRGGGSLGQASDEGLNLGPPPWDCPPPNVLLSVTSSLCHAFSTTMHRSLSETAKFLSFPVDLFLSGIVTATQIIYRGRKSKPLPQITAAYRT